MADLTTVIFGGPSPEHDISILTGLQCERVLTDAGRSVQSIYWTRAGNFLLVPTGREAIDFVEGRPAGSTDLRLEVSSDGGFLVQRRLRSSRLDVGTVLNCCHGSMPEGGLLVGLMELCQIPCTGGSFWSGVLGMDKLAFGAFVQSIGLPTVPRSGMWSAAEAPPFEGPYIVKPRFGGSSIGIAVADDYQTALALVSASPLMRQGAVIEPYLKGCTDLNVAFRTRPHFEASLIEKPMKPAEGFYDFKSKYMQGEGLASAPRQVPAEVSPSVAASVAEFAQKLVKAGPFAGIGRIDFLLVGEEELYVNEVNTIPGAMSLYLWPEGVQYADVLMSMIEEAERRPSASTSSSETPGEALRVASGISQKLMRSR